MGRSGRVILAGQSHMQLRVATIRRTHPLGRDYLRLVNASRNAGFVAAVSDLALIMPAPTETSFAHAGTSPHFISESCRTGSLGFWRMTGTG
jgi:hypothetical protein